LNKFISNKVTTNIYQKQMNQKQVRGEERAKIAIILVLVN
jgi:hypothetical protein